MKFTVLVAAAFAALATAGPAPAPVEGDVVKAEGPVEVAVVKARQDRPQDDGQDCSWDPIGQYSCWYDHPTGRSWIGVCDLTDKRKKFITWCPGSCWNVRPGYPVCE